MLALIAQALALVFDLRHIRWAHNLLLNLADFSLASRALAIGPDAEACSVLRGRVPSAGCGCSSYLRAGRNATVDAALRRWKIGPGHVYHLWWQRWYFLSEAVGLGYRVLSLDGKGGCVKKVVARGGGSVTSVALPTGSKMRPIAPLLEKNEKV